MEEQATVPALDKKYRPQSLEEMVGNAELLASIKSILGRTTGFPSSFLLVGPSGCGKTTLARIIARMLGGTDNTIQEYNISNMTGVDTARKIIDHTMFMPFGGKKKIYVLNEVHRASKNYQDAMLEILEEPPPYVHFILCTTDPQNLLKTIVTRCTKLQVKPLRAGETLLLLNRVCGAEGVEVEPEVLNKIAQSCEGSPRMALVMLDAVIDCAPEERMESIAKASLESSSTLELCQALLEKRAWSEIAKILGKLGSEPEEARMGVLTYMEKVLLSVPVGKQPGPRQVRAWEIASTMGSDRFYHRAYLTAKCFELVTS